MYIISDVVDRGGFYYLKFVGYYNKNVNFNFIIEVIVCVSFLGMI